MKVMLILLFAGITYSQSVLSTKQVLDYPYQWIYSSEIISINKIGESVLTNSLKYLQINDKLYQETNYNTILESYYNEISRDKTPMELDFDWLYIVPDNMPDLSDGPDLIR